MKYVLKRSTGGSFDEVTEAVEASIEAHGFVVSGTHDVHDTVASKGFTIRPVRIYEVSDSGHVGTNADEMQAGAFGRLAVFEDGDRVSVGVVHPGVVTKFFPEAGLESTAAEIEERIVRVVEDVVGGPSERS